MKNNFLTVMAWTGLITFSSCSKNFLEQSSPNSISADQNFRNQDDIALAVNGVYQALRSSNCIGEGANTWTDDRADDLNSTDNQSNNGEPFQFTAFSLTPNNTYLYDHWAALYTPIARANKVLTVIKDIPFTNDAVKTQYIAEMKFIRALMFFNLVREFGGVPLVTEADRLTEADQVKALSFRATREEVYDRIISDLKDVAASNLPVVQSVTNKGRVSLQAANALLGQAYLHMAASGVDAPNAQANFNNAKTSLLACYGQRGFNELADVPFADVFNVNKKTTCPEIIWQIVYKRGDQNYSSSKARSNQAVGEHINSKAASTGSGGVFTLDLLKEFETGDARTDYSIKYATNPSVQAYFITKFRDTSDIAGDKGYGGNDFIIIRYADVILNIAEAYMYLNDEVNAIKFLNMTRARAGQPSYQDMMQNDPAYAGKYPTLKLAILHERRVELAFEHHRWHDLVRFFNPQELVAYIRAKNQADYNNSPLTNCTEKDYYFPIPQNETKIDLEKMHQNLGY